MNLFDYVSGLKEYFNRQGNYLPGQIAKTGWKMVDALSVPSGSTVDFGQVVKTQLINGVPVIDDIEEDDTSADFYGVVVADEKSQTMIDYNNIRGSLIHNYIGGQTASVMRAGYIAVPVQNGTPVVGEPVYVRVSPSDTNPNLPIGGIEALGAVGNVEWKGARFESGATFPMAGTNTSTSASAFTSQTAIIYVSEAEYGFIPEITQAPTVIDGNNVVYGTTAGELVLQGGSAEYEGQPVDGTFVLNNPTHMYTVGQQTITATFIPDDPNYERVSNVEVTITVTPGTPTLLVAPVAGNAMYYGDILGTVELKNGAATVPGTFVWEEVNTRPQTNGPQLAKFVPTDSADWSEITGIEVEVTVNKVPLVPSVLPTASDVAMGETLSNSTLSGGLVHDAITFDIEVEGAWSWMDENEPVTGSANYMAKFTPNNIDKYEVMEDVPVRVNVT